MNEAVDDIRGRWADLPGEILSHIAECMEARYDFFGLLNTCKSWRTSRVHLHLLMSRRKASLLLLVAQPPPLVCLVQPPQMEVIVETFCLAAIKRIKRNKIDQISSHNSSTNKSWSSFPKCWVVKVNENLPKSLHLMDLPSRSQILKDFISNGIEKGDVQVSAVLSKCYSLCGEGLETYHVRKLLVIPSTFVDGEFVTLAIYGLERKLAYFKSAEKKWTAVGSRAGYIDVINHNGRFYVVDENYMVEKIHPRSLAIELAAMGLTCDGVSTLVESSGDLLLVLQTYIYRNTYKVRVYKLIEISRLWVEIRSLGDQVIFLYTRSVFRENFMG